MNKLVLLSSELTEKHLDELSKWVWKNLDDMKILLIENAADLYPEERKWFVYYTRGSLEKYGLDYELLNLKKYFWKPASLKEKIKEGDIVWVWWGNTYYLREIFQKSWFEKLWEFLQEHNIVYIWWSAWTIVLCNDLKWYTEVDIPHVSNPTYDGLGWFPEQIIPHWGKEKYAQNLEEIKDYYTALWKNPICIKDWEAIFYNNWEYKII